MNVFVRHREEKNKELLILFFIDGLILRPQGLACIAHGLVPVEPSSDKPSLVRRGPQQ